MCSCVRERSVREHSVFEERSVREHVFKLCSRQGLEGYIQGLWPKSVFELCSNCVRDCVREEMPNLQLCSSVFEQSVFECSCVRVCSCVQAVFGGPFQQFRKKLCPGTLVLENLCSRTRVRAVFEPFVFETILYIYIYIYISLLA